jgi:hypothetical protein
MSENRGTFQQVHVRRLFVGCRCESLHSRFVNWMLILSAVRLLSAAKFPAFCILSDSIWHVIFSKLHRAMYKNSF